MTIWKLVEEGAKELTKNGISPFTRGDLIKYVQKKYPTYGKDSINPIIQGLTDNLKGGAQGAVGKNILHSVGKGLFVLRSQNSTQIKKPITPYLPKERNSISRINNSLIPEMLLNQKYNEKIRKIGGYEFRYICDIEPKREPSGRIQTFMPQDQYENIKRIPLNEYGKGPFCKFKIPRDLKFPGVYALMERENLKYIGETIDLDYRFNMGYGNISPKNCFIGGQSTCCRINNLILQNQSLGLKISLWFFYTLNHKPIEAQLRTLLKPIWNKQ